MLKVQTLKVFFWQTLAQNQIWPAGKLYPDNLAVIFGAMPLFVCNCFNLQLGARKAKRKTT